MTGAPEPFQFGGRLSLDLTWTLRYRAVDPTELLLTPADLRTETAVVLRSSGVTSVVHLDDGLDLEDEVARQGRNANRQASVPPGVAEHVDEHLRGSIDHCGLTDEGRC